MGNPFKTATIVLSIALVLAVGFGSFSMVQNNNNLKEARAEIASLSASLSSVEGSVSGLNGQIGTLSTQLTTLNQQTAALTKATTASTDAIAKVSPSVVFIEVALGDNGQGGTATGSGIIMDTAGYILTNKHVVEGAFAARVITNDRRIYDVDEIFEDDITDLAVIKITAQNLTAAAFGDPATVKLGDTVIAIGYPLGMSPADGGANATSGIISNLNRFFWIDDTPYYDLMEIDAAINPGNSGGALINLKGEIIGINSAGIEGAQGINYAISVATARHVYTDLVGGNGPGHHPYIGVVVDDNIEPLPGEPFSVRLNGAEIVEIDAGSPAEVAGLRFGDVITKFNGQTIVSASDVIRILWRLDIGDKATLVVKRGSAEITVEFTMPRRPVDSLYV